MQTIYDVLQQQGRVVLLPDAIISAILDQLSVRISYNPLECKAIQANPTMMFQHAMHPHCIVFSNAVTGLCESYFRIRGLCSIVYLNDSNVLI
ncbi:hypothetical protein KIN20_035922 [Parelaphostrongylus tenuis]|uniref:Uncharacterized protein n=1 Tax=Parelaphostrongylus tenuis TaxID=148309 RepID=A0AAD5WLA3_PARTN|nr:hypothetical protein KIN20_035922 [Parelaphostrongylus tenuis]